MKTLTLIVAGLLVAAGGMTAATTPVLRRSPLDHTVHIVQPAPVQLTPAQRETPQAPQLRPMLGLPRNG